MKLISSILLFYFIVNINCDDSDEIASLPGLSERLTFRQYSGYLNASAGRRLFYWFVESKSNPKADPLLLWLNGGPGCSSLLGLFTENGPFRVNADGDRLELDEHSWNNFANVLYLESPAGVGFSYSADNNISTNDDQTAADNYAALKSFFRKFPQFAANKLYLTGESYAGVYIPTLALEILRDNSSTIKVSGIAIGNGALDEDILKESKVYYAYYHGLIDTESWSRVEAKCCACDARGKQLCRFQYQLPLENVTIADSDRECADELTSQVASVLTSGINIYNIYDTCLDPNVVSNSSRYGVDLVQHFSHVFAENSLAQMRSIGDDSKAKESGESCVSNGYEVYLNDARVRNAIHAANATPEWIDCSVELLVEKAYRQLYRSMSDHFNQLVHNYRLEPIIVYNGDADLVCDFLGDRQFLESLRLPVVQPYRPWRHDGLNAGFIKRYRGITFVTVRGAGHAVPSNRPQQAIRIIEELIGKSKIN